MLFGPKTIGTGFSSPGHEQHEQKLDYYKQFLENFAHDIPKEHEFKLSFQLLIYFHRK